MITSKRSKYKMSNDNEIDLKKHFAGYPTLFEQFTGEDTTLLKTLLREVDDSPFTLTDWLQSLIVLHDWLDAKQLTVPLEEGIGYISCAAKSVGDSAMLTHLPSLVDDFLNQYGCERAVER